MHPCHKMYASRKHVHTIKHIYWITHWLNPNNPNNLPFFNVNRNCVTDSGMHAGM